MAAWRASIVQAARKMSFANSFTFEEVEFAEDRRIS